MQASAPDTRPVAFVARYLWRHRLSQAIVLAAVLGAVSASLGERYSMKFLVDAMTSDAGGAAAWRAFAIFLACVGGDYFLWRVAGVTAARSFPRIGAELRLDLFRHLIGHSTRYFNERFSGALASRINMAAMALYTVGNSVIWNVLPPAAATIGALIALGTVQWQLAAVLTLAAVAVGGGIAVAAMRCRPLHHEFADHAATVAGEIVDIVANHSTVRMFGAAPRETERLTAAVAREAGAQRRALLSIERLRLAHAVAVWVLSGATLAWGIWLWQQGSISAGAVVLCGTFTLALLQSSRDLAVAVVEMSYHWGRVAEAIATLMVPHDRLGGAAPVVLKRRRGILRLEDVAFRHERGQVVLDGVSFSVDPGERVAIVGPSGAGKSTLLALIQHLYPVDRGRILVDGQDIATLDPTSLRCAIALVPQDISLFHRTILENIRYGRADATDAEVIEAARAACCEEFIANLPQGYATLAGERGTLLSVGQKQRIAIARALVTRAPIILLDEATSALDVESELAVQRAIAALDRDRTVVAVAHRLSTIAGFDRVVVLENGRIVEDGAPGELRRRGGSFARLWQLQQNELARADHHPALKVAG